MIIVSHYSSLLGDILIAVQNDKLVGLWLENQKHYLSNFKENVKEDNQNEIILQVRSWLDMYFNRENPSIKQLDIELIGTEFQKMVWKILQTIPYGTVITYKDIALEIAKQKGIKSMSSQAVGSAVGRNPISIIIPCHRVLGSNKSLTGYAGGIDKKIKLLELENVELSTFTIPKEKSN